ncbi:MAG: hypothetical protein WCG29_08015 [Desulfomonile sp.]
MMSKSHFWVVCDAVSYIKKYGNEDQKTALQTLEIAYGQNKSVQDIPAQQSAVERLVGFESLHTDKFGDLSLTFQSLPGGGKSNITGLGFHMFTAFNHFINPYPDTDVSWPGASGYSYTTSSMKGFDSLVVKGISEHLRGLVDVENSLAIQRIESCWKEDADAWNKNFSQGLSQTKFAPWNVLARFYHSYLLCNHYEPLEVRGPNKDIVGLQLLGPLVHAAADACSVQHVRSTLGFGHTIWENYLKAKVYNRQINASASMVSRFLSEEPFDPSPVIPEGPLTGRFDAEQFICRLAARTADRLQASTGQSWRQLWSAGDKFWRNYLLGATVREDSQYLYNMAVAGTVNVIVKSYQDLVKHDVLSPGKGLLHPEKMPKLELVQSDIPELPMKKSIDGPPSEDVMPVPFSHARDMLGFVPVGQNNLQQYLDQASALLSKIASEKLELGKIKRLFGHMEKELMEQYRRMEDKMGRGFCPLRAVEKLPLDSDISAHFGTGTFRMPSSEECDDPRLMEHYMDLSDAHAYKANKLQLTQLIAGFKFYRNRFAGRADVVSRIDRATTSLEQLRECGMKDSAAEALNLVVPRSSLQASVVRPARTSSVWETVTNSFSVFEEWLAPLFRVPVTALATAAAAVLLVVVMLPQGVPEPIVGLSGEKWEKPQLTLMSPKSLATKPVPTQEAEKPRMALLLSFKDFQKPLAQEIIDSSYRAIRPTASMEREFDILSPDKIKEAVDKQEIRTGNLKELLDDVAKKFRASKALIFTVTSKGDRFEIESELKNLETGQSTTLSAEKDVSGKDIHAALRRRMEAHFSDQ